jgi:hypothetical protein
MLHALRAFDADQSISQALADWYREAEKTLENLESYLRDHRHDDQYDSSTLRPIKQAFRDDYQYGHKVCANFSGKFRGQLAKLLRRDSHDDPLLFEEYQELLSQVQDVFGDWEPTKIEEIEQREDRSGEHGTFDQLWVLVANYTAHVGDEGHRDAYEELLRREPWTECDCRICQEYGIEVAIFRGNNRNRRRGFHNTRRFYDEFERDLPKMAILTRGGTSLSMGETVEEFLCDKRKAFWKQVHDLPVTEVGAVTANGVHEWWEDAPRTISFAPQSMQEALGEFALRYQELFIDGESWMPEEEFLDAIQAAGCEVHVVDNPADLRRAVLERLGYGSDFVPNSLLQSGLTEY